MLLLAAPAVLAQSLTVENRDEPAKVFDLAALRGLAPVSMRIADDAGQEADYACTGLSAILVAAGVKLGKSLGGERLTEHVIVEASDGYRVLFALAELDPLFRDRPVLLCHAKDGRPLPEKEGPLRLVVADESRHARWVRHVTSMRIGRAP
jgi:hypothetical protein